MDLKTSFDRSIEVLKGGLAGPENNDIGFFASSVNIDNYKRLFTRDAFWMGMAALVSECPELIQGFKNSINTLKNYQRDDGAIPSNVSPDNKVSFGKVNPRIDSNTLYVIGCAEYCKHTKDNSDLRSFFPSVEKAIKYLEDNWECDNCGLLHTPPAGNWADEYFQEGIVLYDEVLWYIALYRFHEMLDMMGDERASSYEKKSEKIKIKIKENFWVTNAAGEDDDVYAVMRKKFDLDKNGYFMHFYYTDKKKMACFSEPHGSFDAFGNSLAILTGVATKDQTQQILKFIDEVAHNKYPLAPAHYPFFFEKAFGGNKRFQYKYKEYIGHYHNGGLWPWYTGVYVAALAGIGDKERASRFMIGIARANNSGKDGNDFYEYHSSDMAAAKAKIVHAGGLDSGFSEVLSKFAEVCKSSIQLKYKGKTFNVTDKAAAENICINCFTANRGENVDIKVVGPDAKDVLKDITALDDEEGNRYFGNIYNRFSESAAGGTPCLGVSAAAFVLAYKAVVDNRILFFNTYN